MTPSPAERYLRLGLRVGRHVDGIVDAYFGPPALAAEVEAEPPVEPRELVAAADGLLGALDEGWLRDQVAGLRTYAAVPAGDALSYADEVEGCYGVRPAWTDEAVFEAAHARLDRLLPGDGPLAGRLARWEASTRVPPGRLEEALAATVERARAWTRRLVDLPGGEEVTVELASDVPWLAFCEYLGDLRSRIRVNADLPISALELLVTACHETYPGHHAERCLKEHELVRGRGLLEEAIVLVPTPQSLVSEGIATLAPRLVLADAGEATVAVAGVERDLAHALAVHEALEPCRWAEVNAALLLHEHGAGEDEARAYLARWGLLSPELTAHMIRFLREPTSRTYAITYPAGRELCGDYVGGDHARLRRLLAEQLRVRDLHGA